MSAQNRLPTWREINLDTTPETDMVLFTFWRTAPAWQKWAAMSSLNQTAQELALAGLQNRFPSASEDELRRLLADIILGSATAAEVYCPPPSKENLK